MLIKALAIFGALWGVAFIAALFELLWKEIVVLTLSCAAYCFVIWSVVTTLKMLGVA